MNNIIAIVSIQRTASSKQGVLLTDKKNPHTHMHTHNIGIAATRVHGAFPRKSRRQGKLEADGKQMG